MFWTEVDNSLRKLMEHCRSKLDNDTITGVEHYLDHDEYEMAFEGLFIDLMEAGFWPPDLSLSYYLEVGKNLGLEKESTFHPNFWEELLAYSGKRNS